jgi:hypothetical protein
MRTSKPATSNAKTCGSFFSIEEIGVFSRTKFPRCWRPFESNGDPTQDISLLAEPQRDFLFIVKNGRIYKDALLQTLIPSCERALEQARGQVDRATFVNKKVFWSSAFNNASKDYEIVDALRRKLHHAGSVCQLDFVYCVPSSC